MTALVVRAASGRVALRIDRRAWSVCLVLIVAIAAVSAASLSTGDYHVPLLDVARVLLGGGSGIDRFIVETLRLPRLLAGILVGVALGAGGAIFQSVSRNPLGSPDVVGFNTGAATGALVVLLVLHGSAAATALGAIVGGVGTALVVYLLAIRRGVPGYRLILIGIGIAAILSSVNSYLLTRADVIDAQSATVWLTGSLNGRGWDQVQTIAVAVAVLLPLATWLARDLRLLELGDDMARALGIRAERTRLHAIVVGVGLSAVATAVAGPIAFVALSAPQIARRLTKSPGPNVLPAALTGALLLSASDLASQRIFPTELPVGIATAAVGGAYLAWLLSSQWRRGRG